MLAKIKWFQVAIILAVLTTLAVAGIFFGLIKPLNERFDAAETNLQTQTQTRDTARSQLPAAQKDTQKATLEVASAKRDWRKYDLALMPNIDLKNRFTATRQLWNEQLKTLGPKVLKFLYADRSVRVVQESIAVPQPNPDPNFVAQQKVLVFPMGNIAVSGTFEQVLKHTERWNRFDRLALVDGLVLAGNSPALTGQYSVTIYEIVHYDDGVGPVIPQAGSTTGAGGGSGYPGASGGGYPGAPGGGYPGAPGGSYPGGPEGPPMMGGPGGPPDPADANGVR